MNSKWNKRLDNSYKYNCKNKFQVNIDYMFRWEDSDNLFYMIDTKIMFDKVDKEMNIFGMLRKKVKNSKSLKVLFESSY